VERQHRHQLKHDEFKDTLVQIEEYIKQHAKEILNIAILVVVVVGLAGGLKYYTDRQESAANADLGEALSTFRAYVGQPTPGQTEPGGATYPTAQEKYKKALLQFDAILENYKMLPRPKAVAIARYQAGVCQSLLDEHSGAILTLTEASQDHDELAKSGKTPEAAKLFQELADHPTLAVPRASALLALADAYRESQPARARKIYEQVEKEFVSNAPVTQAVKQQISSLTP
jgi:tetratricopeptide (TPR) repeat protein